MALPCVCGVRLDLLMLTVQTLLEVCSLFVVSCTHRVELAVGVLQMGRCDSELRSHPRLPAETCFSFIPVALTPPLILIGISSLSTCYPLSYTFTDCVFHSTIRKNAGSPQRWFNRTMMGQLASRLVASPPHQRSNS
jgi:hypothetical protein